MNFPIYPMMTYPQMRPQTYPYSMYSPQNNPDSARKECIHLERSDRQGNVIQALFDYVVEAEAPVASTSGRVKITKASKPSERVINKPVTTEPPESIKPISEVVK